MVGIGFFGKSLTCFGKSLTCFGESLTFFGKSLTRKKKARFGESRRNPEKSLCSQIIKQQIKYALPYFYFSEKREKREKLKKAESILENEKWTFINVQIMKS